MKTLISVFITAFLPISVVAGTLEGKGIFCSGINQGFFFEVKNTVRIYRIYGMEVWDWELSSYDEVGAHQIEWYYEGQLFHWNRQTLKLNGTNELCEFVHSGVELKRRISPLPFFKETTD